MRFLAIFIAAALCAAKARADGVWTPVGLCGGGALFTPAISRADPRLILLNCDMSGAYLSRDGGSNWTMIDQGQLRSDTQCRPAFHPTDTNVIFAAQDGALKVTHDGGQHWSALKTPAGRLRGEIGIDPGSPGQMLIGDEQRVYRSFDGGGSWIACDGPQGCAIGFHFDQTSPAGRRTLAAATSRGIWRSADGGNSWRLVSERLGREILSFCGGSNARRGRSRWYCSTPGRLVEGRLTGGVFGTSDLGDSWETTMSGGINVETNAFDPWAQGPVAQYPWVLTCDSNPDEVWAFNSSTGVPPPHHCAAYHSSDAGRTWRATFFPDPRFPGYNCGPEFMTAVDGQYYQGTPLGVAIDAGEGSRVVQTDSSYCFITADRGEHWRSGANRPAQGFKVEREPRWESNGLVVTTAWNHYIDPFESNRHYLCYTDIGFARSLDRGATWIWWARAGRAPWSNTTYELAFDPEVPGKIWGAFSDVHDIPNFNIVGGGHRTDRAGSVCLSTNFAASWEPRNRGLPQHPVTSVILDPGSPKGRRTLYASVYGYGVFKSVNDGVSWLPSSAGITDAANRRVCRLQRANDAVLFVLVTGSKAGGRWAPGAGVYRSSDNATTWQKITVSQEFAWPKDLTADPADSNILYVGAADANGQDQAGLWRTTDGGVSWKRLIRAGAEHFGGYLHPARPGWVYATLTEGATGAGLWLSQDNGGAWKPMKLPFSNAQRVAFDPADPTVIYVSTFGGGVWKGPASE